MAWKIEFDRKAEKLLRKLDRPIQKKILSYLENRIAAAPDPRLFGKPLIGDKAGLWRCRFEDYRILCELREQELLVLVVEVGHRKEVY